MLLEYKFWSTTLPGTEINLHNECRAGICGSYYGARESVWARSKQPTEEAPSAGPEAESRSNQHRLFPQLLAQGSHHYFGKEKLRFYPKPLKIIVVTLIHLGKQNRQMAYPVREITLKNKAGLTHAFFSKPSPNSLAKGALPFAFPQLCLHPLYVSVILCCVTR